VTSACRSTSGSNWASFFSSVSFWPATIASRAFSVNCWLLAMNGNLLRDEGREARSDAGARCRTTGHRPHAKMHPEESAGSVTDLLLVNMTEHAEEGVNLLLHGVLPAFASTSLAHGLQAAGQVQGELHASEVEAALLDEVFHL